MAAASCVGRVEGLFDRRQHLALNRKRPTGDARAGRRGMTAAAKLGGDQVHVHVLALGAQTDPDQPRLDLLEEAGDDHRLDGAEVIDQAFRVVRPRVGAGVIRRLEPKVGGAVLVRQMKVIIDVLEQADARERIGLINLVADFGEVRTALHEFAGDVEGVRAGGGILERAGVGGYGGEQTIGNGRGDRPIGRLQETENQFARGGLFGRHPVEVGVARVAGVMVDVDEPLSVLNVIPRFAEPLEAGAIGGNHAVKSASGPGRLIYLLRVQKGQLGWQGVLVPANDFFALVLQGQRQAQLRTNAVPVRPDVADDTDGMTLANPVEDALDDARLHSTGDMDFSSSAMMASTRLPRTTESSTTKRSCGVYLRMTDLAIRPWMRARCLWSRASPVRCCSGLPKMPMKTVARRKSPATSTSLTLTRPA